MNMTREKDEAIALACNKISALVCQYYLSADSLNCLRAVDITSLPEKLPKDLDIIQNQVDFIREFLPEDLR